MRPSGPVDRLTRGEADLVRARVVESAAAHIGAGPGGAGGQNAPVVRSVPSARISITPFIAPRPGQVLIILGELGRGLFRTPVAAGG
jgi:hypothetical protein